MEIHERVKTLADGVICLSERYHEGCMQRRNRYLIDNSSSCICYLSHAGGGTAYTVRYAKDSGLPVPPGRSSGSALSALPDGA